MSEPATLPGWWSDPARGVTNSNPVENKGVAIIGQLKHMATQAHAELEALLPGGAGFDLPFDPPPQSPTPEWYQNQKKALNLGQLKAVAKPFYDRLNAISPQWVEQQLNDNGLHILGTDYFQDAASGHYYPWNPSTPVSENYRSANVGQLKLVFCLRFRENEDGDSMFDLWERAMISAHPGSGITDIASLTDEGDIDNDGLGNLTEYQNGLDPFLADSDGDGLDDQLRVGLLGHWRMDGAPGSTLLADSSTAALHGELLTGSRIAVGISGSAVALTHDQQMRITPAPGQLNVGHNGADFTVSFWIRLHANHEPGWNTILQKGNNSNTRTFHVSLRPDGQKLHARLSSVTSTNEGIDSSVHNMVPGEWTHVSYVHDNGELKLYINGSLDSTATVGGSVANDDPFYIGKSAWLRGINADFDEVMVHNRALSITEILNIRNRDSDGDGTSDALEYVAGTNANDASTGGSDDPLTDTDGDGLNNREESVWWDSAITWPRTSETTYAVIELDNLGTNPTSTYVSHLDLVNSSIHPEEPKNEWTIQSLGNAGHVLVLEDRRGPPGAEGALNPATIPGSIKNHIWNPSAGTWTLLKNDRAGGTAQHALGVATDVSADGKIAGYGWIPLADSNGDPMAGPGVERVVLKWADLGVTTIPSMETDLIDDAHATFSTDNDRLEIPFHSEGIAMTDDGNILYTQSNTNVDSLDLRLAGVTVASYGVSSDLNTGAQMTGQGDVFYKDPASGDYRIRLAAGTTEAIAQGAQKPGSITSASRIGNPANTDIAALENNAIWARTANGWKKIQPHPVRPFPGGKGVSKDFTILLNDGQTILRNGKHLPIESLVSSPGWTDFRMEKINSHGLMAGRATKNGQDKVVLLLPVDLDVDNNGNYNDTVDGIAKYLPGYVGNDSKLDDGASFDEASYAGAQAMRIRIPGLKPDKATFKITDVTTHAGYASNGKDDALQGNNAEDFSFAAAQDKRTIEATVDSSGVWAPIHCKDYGAWCEIEITLKKQDGSAIGAPIKITLPADTNDDLIADHWQKQQVRQWNTQFNLGAIDPGWVNPEKPETWGLVFGAPGAYKDAELIDPDGRGPLPPHKTVGDGLDALKEYRGYVTDFIDPGHNGGHKRMSVAKKELLVEVSEMPGIQDAIDAGENPNVNYSLQSLLSQVTALYENSIHGVGVDVYWARDEVKLGGLVDYNRNGVLDAGERPHARLWSGPVKKTTEGNEIGGGAYVQHDLKLKKLNRDLYRDLYEGPTGTPDLYKVYMDNRHPELEDFTKLVILTRWGKVLSTDSPITAGSPAYCLVDKIGPAVSKSGLANHTWEGSLVAAAGVAEEAEEVYKLTNGQHYSDTEFSNVLAWAIGHEIGHLLVGPNHFGSPTALMSIDPGPGRVGITVIKLEAVEMKEMNFKDKASVDENE